MKHLRRISILAVLFAALTGPESRAQFYTSGNESAFQRWSYVETQSYRVIYPRGLDSLGRACAAELELAVRPLGGSIGVEPGANYRRPLPVVLHPGIAYNNGYVSWAPSRMELMLGCDAYDRISLPTLQELAVHEGRHVAQMQLGGGKPFRYLKFLLGQMPAGALAIYGGPVFLEGDAVVAETALTRGGRGRSADFLEYIRTSLDAGEPRDFWRWCYGSQRLYTPDHYRIGYMMEAGVLAYADDPQFAERFYSNIRERNGLSLCNYRRTIKQATGKGIGDSFNMIADTLGAEWARAADSRAPYTPSVELTANRKYYTAYTSPIQAWGRFYAISSSIDRGSELVRLDSDGKVLARYPFASESSRLQLSKPVGRIFWSEFRSHPRWEMLSESAICYLDSLGRRGTLVSGSKLYNPAPHDSLPLLAVTCDPGDGSSSIQLISAQDGCLAKSLTLPSGMQAVECCWLSDELYFSAVSSDGFGIYRASDLSCVLPPKHRKIKQLRSRDGELLFVSDLSGVNEVYALSADGSSLHRLTSSRLGSDEFFLDPEDRLYFAVPGTRGSMLHCSGADSLQRTPETWEERDVFPMAEKLSAGETVTYDRSADVAVSEPRNYSRLGHLFRVHSWAPVYFNMDEASSLSMETITQVAAPGAVAFTQNTLGTLYGWAGVKLTDERWAFRPSGHMKLNYRGLYPVFELELDFNDRDSKFSRIVREIKEDGSKTMKIVSGSLGRPLIKASLDCYVPLKFNSGGWLRGVIPDITWTLSNDCYSLTVSDKDAPVSNLWTIGRLTGSVRLYAMQPTPSSCIYPRLGIGLNVGISGRPALAALFGNKFYCQLYGYLPGFASTHGIKFSVLSQAESDNHMLGETYARTLPRGMTDTKALSASTSFSSQTKFALDYAMPLFSVDWSGLGAVAYVKNFELIPYFDCTLLSGGVSKKLPANTMVWGAGAQFDVVLGNLLFLPYETRIGLSAGYLHQKGLGLENKPTVSFVFGIDI